MKKDEFDNTIKEALEGKVSKIEPSPYMLQKIKIEASSKSRRETFNMKFSSTKKLAVIGVLCFASITCYAASKMAGSVSHTSRDITSIEQVDDNIEKIGFTPKYVEAFDNGFAFVNGGTGGTSGIDENGETVGDKYKTLTLSYENEEGKHVTFVTEEGNPYVDSGEGFDVGYISQKYMFVPEDYTLTDEDKAAEASGEIVISYGSSEVEVMQMENYSWEDGGIYYTLVAPDCDFGEEGMVDMVNQIKAK